MAAWGAGAVTACMHEGLYVPCCIEFCRLRIRRGNKIKKRERNKNPNMLISMKYRKVTHLYCECRKIPNTNKNVNNKNNKNSVCLAGGGSFVPSRGAQIRVRVRDGGGGES